MRRILLLIYFQITLTGLISAQGVAVGEWRDHLPYSTVTDVAVTDDLIYAATPYSLFYYDVLTWEIVRFSTVQGLSDIGISSIEYSKTYKTLVVGYSNTNIDLILPDSTVFNLPDIKRKSIPGNKTINNVVISSRFAYLCCGFGIVVIDIPKKEIKDTYYIGDNGAQVNVKDIEFYGDSIFASSDEGIYKADLNSSNLAYFGNWSKMNVPVPNGNYTDLEVFSDKLFTTFSLEMFDADTVYYHDGNSWEKFTPFAGVENRGLNVSENKLVVCGYSFLQVFDTDLNSLGSVFQYNSLVPNPNEAEFTTDGFLFVGDQNYGLLKTWGYWNSMILRPEGPFSTNSFSLAVNGNNISTVPGGYNESWISLYRPAEISVFNNENWEFYYGYITDGLDTISDLVTVQTVPTDPRHIFAGSFGGGLIEFNDGVMTTVYDESNSILSPVSASPDRVNVAGLTFDSDGNLWIATTGNNKFLSVRKANGQFKTFTFSSAYSFSSATSPVIDQNNYKWIALPRNEGIFVFDDNNTIDVTSDDQYKKLTTSEGYGALPSLGVYSIAADHDNEIWIGTDAGIAVIYDPVNVFEGGNYDAQQILVDVGGFVQPLLESEKVKCIAVDGANRKWVGTEKAGVFLLSEDGTEEICHFTSTNSPLLSDDINGISIIPESGEVFFATASGIISYRGMATVAKASLDSVLVFPNPVMSDFNGYVSVSGLIENGWVSITDVFGTLIYKTRALGGQAVWNCIDMNGDRPATGVYLVFVTNDDGSVTRATKLMFYH
ncbi:MAG: hypothetical protein A2W93_07445 [Bacteroidetes bacterium GWF2_43_63]|nr:MAG: hypothetical protein A2W94_15515 [Bacteroidetes bacterium GWE2_42_42]OFY54059.1 MAG: hypothetical protein A2W93_07445 [Bacteroidetes bacterium GWF2_43_63]HCB63528.1 hypothetical protein [Bacteroidales bacterium]HCY23226.1 hypothetical protein [Bacteroidales bacterium]